jgi:glycosyltransferase involved in cell wall biosynthesis
MSLRIGINALYLVPGEVGGTEIYLRFLLNSLSRIDRENEYTLFLNQETPIDLIPSCSRFFVVHCPVRATFRPARLVFEQARLPRLLKYHSIDVLLNPGYTAPVFAHCPQVTVFHDLQHKAHPEFFRAWELPFWTFFLARSAACSSRLIAVSDSTASDIAKWFPSAVGKVAVVSHGVDPEFYSVGSSRLQMSGSSSQANRPFILAVSTLHPHKNLERAIDAFQQFQAVHPQYRMVVAGLRGFAAEKLQRHVQSLKLTQDVDFTGWIPRGDLYRLFAGASAFLAPSLFEGFGLPLLEALAAGIPTACSSIPSFREIAHDVAHMFDPGSTEDIRRAFERVTQDDHFRTQAVLAGPRRARMFGWDDCAEGTLRQLKAAGGANRPESESSQTTGAQPSPTKKAWRARALPTSSAPTGSQNR